MKYCFSIFSKFKTKAYSNSLQVGPKLLTKANLQNNLQAEVKL